MSVAGAIDQVTGPALPSSVERRTMLVRRALAFWSTRIGTALVALTLALAFLGPLLAPHNATDVIGTSYVKPSGGHPLGLDYLGRDGLSRLLLGGRLLIAYAFAATIASSLIGVGVGLLAAYSRGRLDDLLMRITDILMAFPPVLLALVLLTGAGQHPWLAIVAVVLSFAPRTARLIRGAALEVVTRPYVEAAEARGESTRFIIFREVVPNVWTPILVDFGVRLGTAIVFIASLSFLGLGVQQPAPDWGLMINENRNGLTFQPWLVVAPAIAIALLSVGVNLIADGFARAVGRGTRTRDLSL